MLGPALPFRPNAKTIIGSARLWWNAALQADVWLRLYRAQESLFAPGQRIGHGGDPVAYAEFIAAGDQVITCRLWARPPDDSRTESLHPAPSGIHTTSIATADGRVSWHDTPDGLVRSARRFSTDLQRRKSDRFWNSGRQLPEQATLAPHLLFIGLSPVPGSERSITWNDRPAHQIDFVRMIDPASPESIATDDVPNHEIDGADRVEFVIDDERNIILEWRCITNEQVYRRFWFTELEFDQPIDDALFDLDSGPKPPPVPDPRPATPPAAWLIDAEGARIPGHERQIQWLIDGVPTFRDDGEDESGRPAITIKPPVHIELESTGGLRDLIIGVQFPDQTEDSMHPAMGPMLRATPDPAQTGEARLFALPLGDISGRVNLIVNAMWPPPRNSGEPPHPDVPVYIATWEFRTLIAAGGAVDD